MRENKIFGVLLIILVSLFLASAAGPFETKAGIPKATTCCERTVTGAWCLNSLKEQCDTSINPNTNQPFRSSPTSCDATSFCKSGCCYDSQQGLCMENTPQRVCQESGGVWADSAQCSIPQCQLGCCVLGNEAALSTLVRCKKLAGFYGLETDFRKNIQSETDCIAVANEQDLGACVYEFEFERTCKFTSRGDCAKIVKNSPNSNLSTNATNLGFYKDFLCSSEELGTNCGPTTKTTCIDGKDEVYFLDSCGNTANIYDASKINDKSYWNKIKTKEESCNYGKNVAGSRSCGNCDYLGGSYCRKADKTTSPSYGDYYCKDLSCKNTQNGKDYKHGESWCVYDTTTGFGRDSVGSGSFRHICYAGEEMVEPCADFRQQFCLEDKTTYSGGTFSQAACIVNRWQDCTTQTREEDCLNIDRRECYWETSGKVQVGGLLLNSQQVFSNPTSQPFSNAGTSSSTSSATENEEEETNCVPFVPPGLSFWQGGESQGICSLASKECVVEFEEGILGKEKCKKNCECLNEEWAAGQNNICKSLGDCGGYYNWAGKYTDDGYLLTVDDKEQSISLALIQQLKDKAAR
jgi:hypothetical protein